MDIPTPPIILGLENLVSDSLRRVTALRYETANRAIFDRLASPLKRLQVGILLLRVVYKRYSRYEYILGSGICLEICYDNLVEISNMMEALLQEEVNNLWKISAGALIEKLPGDINSFISSVELLRSTYQDPIEFILESLTELANLRRQFSMHLLECSHLGTVQQPAGYDNISEDGTLYDRPSSTDTSGQETSITEFDGHFPSTPHTSTKSVPDDKDELLAVKTGQIQAEETKPDRLENNTENVDSGSSDENKNSGSELNRIRKPTYRITILGQHDSYPMPILVPARATLNDNSIRSWVSRALLKRANIEHKISCNANYPADSQTYVFNGEVINCQGVVELTWCLERKGRRSRIRTSKFSICDELPVDVIIGRKPVKKSLI